MSTAFSCEGYTGHMSSPLVGSAFLFMKRTLFFLFCFIFLLFAPHAFAAMSSSNYMVQWDSISVGASDTQSSSSYRVRSSLDLGVSGEDFSSASYRVDGGFRGGVYDPVSTFQLFVQDTSTQVAATAATATTVTVTSVAGYAVGNRVLLVQDEGVSQVTAMGKITSIMGNDITVDSFVGGSPVIDGSGGDYLYKMATNGTSLPLSAPTPATVVTGAIAWEATADIQTGYSVYLMEDDDLHASGLDEIPDVADGAVTAGTSEYGARSSDSSLSSSTFDTQDTAITTSPQLVASRSAVTFLARDHVTLKLAISTSQQGGTYSQNLYVLFAGNY